MPITSRVTGPIVRGGGQGPRVRIQRVTGGECIYAAPAVDCDAQGTYRAVAHGFSAAVDTWQWTVVSGDATIVGADDQEEVVIETADAGENASFILRVEVSSPGPEQANFQGVFTHTHENDLTVFSVTFRTENDEDTVTLPLLKNGWSVFDYLPESAIHNFTVDWGDGSSESVDLAGQNCIYSLVVNAVSGTYKLEYEAEGEGVFDSGDVPFDAPASGDPSLQQALDYGGYPGEPSPGYFSVTGSGTVGDPFLIEFFQNYGSLPATMSVLDGDVTLTLVQEGIAFGGPVSHQYATAGDYDVTIDGITEVWHFNSFPASQLQIIRINQWGSNPWRTLNEAFAHCTNLEITATDAPNLTYVEDCAVAFDRCGATFTMNDVGAALWQTGTVKTTYEMFRGNFNFNSPIGNWDLSGLIDDEAMEQPGANGMLRYCVSFNQDIAWQFTALTGEGLAFLLYCGGAIAQGAAQDYGDFNGDVSALDFGSATDLSNMLSVQPSFEGNGLAALDYSSVEDMHDFCVASGVTTENYDAMLNAMALQTLQPNVELDMGDSQYSAAGAAARAILEGAPNNWTIFDGGLAP